MNLGIIGFGYTGQQHARALEQIESASAGGVVEINPDRRAESTIKLYASYRALLEDPTIDAVSVCLLHFSHEEVVSAALQADKHVLVEKPLALSVEAGERLCRMASQASLVLMVEMTHRFMPPLVEARKLISAGHIGNVLAIDDVLVENIELFGSLPGWMFDQSQSGGGVGLTSGVHMVDHVSWLTGQKLTLDSACFGYSQGLGDVEDTAAFFLRLENGSPVQILLSWRSGGPGLEGEIQIIGEEGTLDINPWKGWKMRLSGEEREDIYFEDQLKVTERVLVGMKGALSEFISAIQEGRQPDPTPQEVLQSQRIIEQAYRMASR